MYTAIVNADSICVNAMHSPTGAVLVPGNNERLLTISEKQFLAQPLGKRWNGSDFETVVQPRK